jgi:prolyl-tRNA editing enzyme YbaK/EbsC (Cys-tRNA(Pro) deacylase)
MEVRRRRPDAKRAETRLGTMRGVLTGRHGELASERYASPLSWLRTYRLDRPVITCEDAAAAKHVPLERELKSLVLRVDFGLAVAHIRGDQRLSLRAIKDVYQAGQARLAGPDDLDALGVGPGTITPVLDAIWDLPHSIAFDLFDLSWVTTNAGELDTYVVFPPKLLLAARNVLSADIEAKRT